MYPKNLSFLFFSFSFLVYYSFFVISFSYYCLTATAHKFVESLQCNQQLQYKQQKGSIPLSVPLSSSYRHHSIFQKAFQPVNIVNSLCFINHDKYHYLYRYNQRDCHYGSKFKFKLWNEASKGDNLVERLKDDEKKVKKAKKNNKTKNSLSFDKKYFEESLYQELGALPRPTYPKFHFDILMQHNGDTSSSSSTKSTSPGNNKETHVNDNIKGKTITTDRPSYARLGKLRFERLKFERLIL